MSHMLIFPIAAPIVLGAIMFLFPKNARWLHGALLIAGTAIALVFAALLFGKDVNYVLPWMQWGTFTIDFALRLYNFSGFIILAASAISFLIAVYTVVYMKKHNASRNFFAYMLITLGFVNGAVLANNLVMMLFFWEGLLITLFTMIIAGGRNSERTAIKAVIIDGVADLCLILGVGITASLAQTMAMDQISIATSNSTLGTVAFILMMTGAIAKAGSMPFHSWIPNAALDAPMPFMAFLPAALEKLLGIYLLTRISLDFFNIAAGSALSLVMMITGAVTLLFAVAMALIQKNYKKLLSYHAISQVGYMILGIGTALPIGIVGGLFHMVNNAMYKSALFLTGGAIEQQTGTADLHKMGGIGRKMPITFTCFILCAAAISGVPPFNGFFSKEMIFDAALESNIIFYIIALVGAFCTAASFLKLGHAAYLGKPNKETENLKDPSVFMLIPMILISVGCLLFGVWNALPLKTLIEPVLGAKMAGETFAGHINWLLTSISMVVLLLALLNHFYGAKKTRSGLGAVDHIHYAPGLKQVYSLAESGKIDPYNVGAVIVGALAKLLYWMDRGVNWIYDGLSVNTAKAAAKGVSKAHTGSHWLYILWIILGVALISALVAIFA